MLNTILGLIAMVGFVGYSLPQIIVTARTPRLTGYSRLGWTMLLVAILAIQVQLVSARLWIASGAQLCNTIAAGYTYVAIWHKG